MVPSPPAKPVRLLSTTIEFFGGGMDTRPCIDAPVEFTMDDFLYAHGRNDRQTCVDAYTHAGADNLSLRLLPRLFLRPCGCGTCRWRIVSYC